MEQIQDRREEPSRLKTKKEPLNGFFLNGGLNASKFELIIQRYYSNLATPNTNKICYLINLLTDIA